MSERTSFLTCITGCNYVYQTDVPNKDDVNSALSYYCQVGDILDPVLRPTLSLFSQILSEPCFDQLRTKEQLGYIVSSSQWSFTGAMGFRIIIQSERDPAYLESRVEVFFDYMRKMLAEMPEEEFERQKKSLIDQKLEKINRSPKKAGKLGVLEKSIYAQDRGLAVVVTRQTP